MATITKEQVQKINNSCSNDWKLDIEYYLYHSEKQLVKHIDLDNEHYLKFSLHYNSRNQIVLHISKYEHKPNDYFASSSGMGKCTVLDPIQVKRKIFNNLVDYTKQLNNSCLMQINEDTPVIKDGIFQPSEDF